MVTKKEIQTLYTGPKDRVPKPGDYLYYLIPDLMPITASYTVDEFGQLTITLKDQVQLTAADLKTLFELFERERIARIDIAEDNRVRLILA